MPDTLPINSMPSVFSPLAKALLDGFSEGVLSVKFKLIGGESDQIAGLGIARMGGVGENSSGDLFLCFSQCGEALVGVGRIDGSAGEHHRPAHESELQRSHGQQDLEAPGSVAKYRQGGGPSGLR